MRSAGGPPDVAPADDIADGRRAPAEDVPGNLVDRGFRSTVGRESTTFGFSILVTVTYGVVQGARGAPDTVDLMLYATGAVMSFTILELGFSRGLRETMPQHATRVIARGTALNLLSVLGGLVAALLASRLIGSDLAWPLSPFVAGIVYLALESFEIMLAEAYSRRRGEPDADRMQT